MLAAVHITVELIPVIETQLFRLCFQLFFVDKIRMVFLQVFMRCIDSPITQSYVEPGIRLSQLEFTV